MFIAPEDANRIAHELKETIGHDVNIMDRTGTIIASTDSKRIGQIHIIAQQIIHKNLPVLEVRQSNHDGVQEGINLPIHVDGVCEGVLGITGPADAVRDFGTIAKKMTEILLTSLQQQEQQTLLEQARNLYIQDWLFSPEIDWPTFALRGQLLHIDIDLPWLVALLEYAGTADNPAVSELHSDRFLHMVKSHLCEDPNAIWTVVNHRILILFNGNPSNHSKQIIRDLHYESKMLWNIPLAGGISSASRNAEDLRRCYAEAKIAARVAVRDQSIRTYSSASLDFILQNFDSKIKKDVLNTVFPSMLEPELKDLLDCLRLYFLCDGNWDLAAEKACIHKNTFRYRMQKLHKLTGYDIRKPRDAVMLYIGLQFLDDQ